MDLGGVHRDMQPALVIVLVLALANVNVKAGCMLRRGRGKASGNRRCQGQKTEATEAEGEKKQI